METITQKVESATPHWWSERESRETQLACDIWLAKQIFKYCAPHFEQQQPRKQNNEQ